MTTQSYLVDGMTCGHCAASVSREVRALDGVESVEVDVPSRTVAVASVAPIAEEAIAAAVAEAGYSFAGRA